MNETRSDQTAPALGREEDEVLVTEFQAATEEATISVETVEESVGETEGEEQRSDAGRRSGSFLFRHPEDKMIGGICSGLGDYFGIDPILVRLMWIVLTLGTAGTGLLAYAALWLLLPVGTTKTGQRAPAALELNGKNVERAGVALVAVGVVWLLANLGVLPALWSVFWRLMGLVFWPVLLIGAGILVLKNQQDWRGGLVRAVDRMRRGKMRANSGLNGRSLRAGLRRFKDRIPLKRNREDRLVFGVCGAIGQAIGLDSNLVRLIWVAFAIGSIGTGVLVYVMMGWMLPEEKEAVAPVRIREAQEIKVIDGTVS